MDVDIKLGSVVKDVISGFEGVVTGRAHFLTGCDQVLLTPQSLDKDGKRQLGEWLDIQRCELVPGKPVVTLRPAPNTPGADEPSPARR